MGDEKLKKTFRQMSGFQDFLPDRMLVKVQIIETIQMWYRRFGFLPMETPCLEYADLLLGKYNENEKLIYEFEDKGGRHVALRYDFTVPLSRSVYSNVSKLVFPFRRYQWGPIWRADRPGRGRYREFMQMDADIIGDSSVIADFEILQLACKVMKELNVPFVVRVNSKMILTALADTCGLNPADEVKIMRSIDKYDKIGLEGVLAEIKEGGYGQKERKILEEYLQQEGDPEQVFVGLERLIGQGKGFDDGVQRLTRIVSLFRQVEGDEKCLKIDPTISRGLDYYTGIIFEIMLAEYPSFGSLGSGGRYDFLIRNPIGEPFASVGISIGIDRLLAAMLMVDRLPDSSTTTQVMIVNFGEDFIAEYIEIASSLRRQGIETEIYPQPIKLKKQLKCASEKGIRRLLICGPDEIANKQVIIRDMETGQQKVVQREQVIMFLRK
jgi:histidyl-tRNA synthetase